MGISFQDIKRNIGLVGILLFIAGLVFSPALISISILFIIVQPFLVYPVKEVFKKLLSDKLSVLFLLLYIVNLLGFFYTTNLSATNGYLENIRIKLPFLLIPIGLVYQDLFSKRNSIIIIFFLNLVCFISGLSSFINYMMHQRELDELLLQSKPIPIVTGISHIYFSFILAFATIAAFITGICHLKNRLLKYLNFVMVLGNVLFIHTILARTGLLAFYVAVVVVMIWWGFAAKRYLWMVMALVAFILTGLLSVHYVPSMKNRFLNTKEDVSRLLQGDIIDHWSVSMRFEYWKETWEVFKSSPVIGVGKGDVLDEMKLRFIMDGSELSPENRKNPHNQFLQEMASSGIIGFAVFLLIFLYPIRNIYKKKDFLFLSLFVIMTVTFCFESALERQWGVSFFSLFWLYLAGYSKTAT